MAERVRRQPGSRRDAQRNHLLLVEAAREVFAERGVEAQVDEIAGRAGLGTGTFYRHFPTREALVEAIVAERVGEFLALGESALAEPDAWVGLVGFLESTLELQRGDRVLKEIFVRYPPAEGPLTETRQQIRELFEQLLARAHAQGVLRADFGLPDLALVLWSFAPRDRRDRGGGAERLAPAPALAPRRPPPGGGDAAERARARRRAARGGDGLPAPTPLPAGAPPRRNRPEAAVTRAGGNGARRAGRC